VPITTNVVSLNPAHGGVYAIQHFVIKFVSDWRVVYGHSSVSICGGGAWCSYRKRPWQDPEVIAWPRRWFPWVRASATGCWVSRLFIRGFSDMLCSTPRPCSLFFFFLFFSFIIFISFFIFISFYFNTGKWNVLQRHVLEKRCISNVAV
jgi:hypothetical protein